MGMVRVPLTRSGIFIASAQEAYETLRDRQETNVKQIRKQEGIGLGEGWNPRQSLARRGTREESLKAVV